MNYTNNVQKVDNIKKLVSKRAIVEFDYVDQKMNITTRFVEAYAFDNHKLMGYDLGKAGIRQFELDGIQNIKDTGEKYDKTHA